VGKRWGLVVEFTALGITTGVSGGGNTVGELAVFRSEADDEIIFFKR